MALLFRPFAIASDPYLDDNLLDDYGYYNWGQRRPISHRIQPRYRPVEFRAPEARCVPWRRHALSRPTSSVLDLLNFGSDFERFIDLFEEDRDDAREQQTTAKRVEAPSTDSSAVSDPSSASKKLVHSPTAPSPRLGDAKVHKSEEGSTLIDIALPGLSLGDVKLDFDFKRQALSVKAEKKTEEKDESGNQTSYRYVSFSRLLPIPAGTKPQDVQADLVDGTLHIAIAPKQIEASQPETTPLTIGSPSTKEKIEPAGDANPSASPASEEATSSTANANPTVEATSSTADANPSASSSADVEATSSTAPSNSPSVDSSSSSEATVEDAEE